jgi:hypothetical protein
MLFRISVRSGTNAVPHFASKGRAMAHAVRRQPLTAEAPVRTQTSAMPRVPSVSNIPPMARIHLLINIAFMRRTSGRSLGNLATQ